MTDSEKVKIYESVLHRLQLYGEVTMDRGRLSRLLSLIYTWSYAHRAGNGELTDEEVEENVLRALRRLDGA